VRFDCFDDCPHYHYMNWTDRTNTVWGYDPNSNGPMLAWTLSVLRGPRTHDLRPRQAGGRTQRVLALER